MYVKLGNIIILILKNYVRVNRSRLYLHIFIYNIWKILIDLE